MHLYTVYLLGLVVLWSSIGLSNVVTVQVRKGVCAPSSPKQTHGTVTDTLTRLIEQSSSDGIAASAILLLNTADEAERAASLPTALGASPDLKGSLIPGIRTSEMLTDLFSANYRHQKDTFLSKTELFTSWTADTTKTSTTPTLLSSINPSLDSTSLVLGMDDLLESATLDSMDYSSSSDEVSNNIKSFSTVEGVMPDIPSSRSSLLSSNDRFSIENQINTLRVGTEAVGNTLFLNGSTSTIEPSNQNLTSNPSSSNPTLTMAMPSLKVQEADIHLMTINANYFSRSPSRTNLPVPDQISSFSLSLGQNYADCPNSLTGCTSSLIKTEHDTVYTSFSLQGVFQSSGTTRIKLTLLGWSSMPTVIGPSSVSHSCTNCTIPTAAASSASSNSDNVTENSLGAFSADNGSLVPSANMRSSTLGDALRPSSRDSPSIIILMASSSTNVLNNTLRESFASALIGPSNGIMSTTSTVSSTSSTQGSFYAAPTGSLHGGTMETTALNGSTPGRSDSVFQITSLWTDTFTSVWTSISLSTSTILATFTKLDTSVILATSTTFSSLTGDSTFMISELKPNSSSNLPGSVNSNFTALDATPTTSSDSSVAPFSPATSTTPSSLATTSYPSSVSSRGSAIETTASATSDDSTTQDSTGGNPESISSSESGQVTSSVNRTASISQTTSSSHTMISRQTTTSKQTTSSNSSTTSSQTTSLSSTPTLIGVSSSTPQIPVVTTGPGSSFNISIPALGIPSTSQALSGSYTKPYTGGVRLSNPTPIVTKPTDPDQFDDYAQSVSPGLVIQLYEQRAINFTVSTNGVRIYSSCINCPQGIQQRLMFYVALIGRYNADRER